MLLPVQDALKDVGLELTELRRERGFGDTANQFLGVASIANEIGNRDDGEVVLLCERLELGQTGHVGLVRRDDLTEHTRGVLARKSTEVNGRLSVASALQDATFAVAQREDVARAVQIVRAGRGVNERANGRGAVAGRDAGRGAVAKVDGHRERSALGLSIRDHHEGQIKLVGSR